jgi:hypothetical protein
MDNGDGIAVGWLGHLVFRDKEGRELFVTIIGEGRRAELHPHDDVGDSL